MWRYTGKVVFEEDQIERLGCCLRRLLPHLDGEDAVLTGSAAISVHLSARHLPQYRSVGDVDFVARRCESVSASVTREFLVSHFHLPQPGYSKWLVQLVDPSSRLRVDIFPDLFGSMQRAALFDVAGMRVRVLDPDAILEHKLATLGEASEQRPVDEKHYRDAVLLGHLCDRQVPKLVEALLCKEEYSKDLAAGCSRCDASVDPAFRLAPKQQIFEVLGYI
jgi:hypothetical protein